MDAVIKGAMIDSASEKKEVPLLIGERMIEIGAQGIKVDDLEKHISDIYTDSNLDYKSNQDMINDIGAVIIDNIELLIRMSNPESTYDPEWYNPDEETSVLEAIVRRDELEKDYKTRLVEVFNVPEVVASNIVDLVIETVSQYETIASNHYTEAE